MAYRMVNYGRTPSYGHYAGAPMDPRVNLAGRVYWHLAYDVSSKGYAQSWRNLDETWKTILVSFPLDAPGYYLHQAITNNLLTDVPGEVLSATTPNWSGYGVALATAAATTGLKRAFDSAKLPVLASSRNIQRLNDQLRKLVARRKRVSNKLRQKSLDKRIKSLKARIKKATKKTRDLAKKRRSKGKELSRYRQRSLDTAKKIKRAKAKRAKRKKAQKPGIDHLKDQYPWAFRSTPPKWFMRGKPKTRRTSAWKKLSPQQRIGRFRQMQRRKPQGGGQLPYKRPPQQSPYEPNGMAAEQEFDMDSGIYESGTPTADMMAPYAQEEAMVEAELDSGVDVDGDLLEMEASSRRNLTPLWIGLGAVGLIGILALTFGKKKRKKGKGKGKGKPKAPPVAAYP